jgi:metallo-beta-lactamase family protein
VKISFHGADRGVTGSCHLVECGDHRVLVDCGLYQGGREIDEENAEPFGFDPASIDTVLLTHAHLDHCGRLPLLAKRGFRGEIVCTAPTRELARLVMLDAAHLQEEEAQHRQRWAERRGREHEVVAPLYSIVDAFNTQDSFGRVAVYGRAMQIGPGIRATFFDAGHILGSARGGACCSPAISATRAGRFCATRRRPRRSMPWCWRRRTAIACTGRSMPRSRSCTRRSPTRSGAAAT